MSTYSDGWNEHVQRATVIVHTDTPSAKVTYPGDDGKQFRVIVRQQPNPIGFMARLPGDAPRPPRR